MVPSATDRATLAAKASYSPYSKHKLNPSAYRLTAYAGQDEERTYCDAHAGFMPDDFIRIPLLLRRGIGLGLWSDRGSDDTPALLWTLDNNGWIYELRITNSGLAEYHGYPVVPGDAFAKQVLSRARAVAFEPNCFQIQDDPDLRSAIGAAEDRYR